MVLLVDQVKVGGKAKGRAMAEVETGVMDKAMAEAIDLVMV